MNIGRYDDLSSNLRLCYPETASIRDKYFTLFNFGKISLSVGPPWTGLRSAWMCLARSRHSHTLPLGFGMSIKLLHHSVISSMPKGVTLSCCWNLSNSSLNSFCRAYVMNCGDAWYSLPSGFTCNVNVPSKHPIPVDTCSNSFCSCFVIAVLAFLSLSSLGPGRKYLISLLFDKGLLSGLLLKFEWPWLLVFFHCVWAWNRTFNLIIVNHWYKTIIQSLV